jgi:hypothetical protein
LKGKKATSQPKIELAKATCSGEQRMGWSVHLANEQLYCIIATPSVY